MKIFPCLFFCFLAFAFLGELRAAEHSALVPVRDLFGLEAEPENPERVGTLADLLLDPESGTIGYAVLYRGWIVGPGGGYLLVPWESVSIGNGAIRLAEDFDLQEAEQAMPGHRHRYSLGGTTEELMGPFKPTQGEWIEASTYQDRAVVSPHGDLLGYVQGLYADLDNEKTELVRMQTNQGREILVPRGELRLDRKQGRFVLRVSSASLAQAPRAMDKVTPEDLERTREFFGSAASAD